MNNFIRPSPPQMAFAIEQAKKKIATLELALQTAEKDRDDALARVAELVTVIADDSRNAINPPPPVAPAPDAIDYVVFEDGVREALEFYAGGGHDFGNRAAKIINEARLRAQTVLANESGAS